MLDETVEARCDELGVSSRVQQAADSLSGLISSGLRVSAIVGALLQRLERLAARDGRRVAHASSGARAAVRLLAQACAQHAGQLFDLLPAMVRFGARSLSDCEDSVRDAFVAALAAAVREHAPHMTAEAARAQLVAPFVGSLGNQSNSRGGALALRSVLRSLSAHQLHACEDTVSTALKRHLGAGKPGITTQPQLRALLLDCVATMLSASESPDAVTGLATIAVNCAHAPDWRERLAAVSVLRSVPILQLPAHMRAQHAATLAKLRYDASSLVRQSINDARTQSGSGQPWSGGAAALSGRAHAFVGGGAAWSGGGAASFGSASGLPIGAAKLAGGVSPFPGGGATLAICEFERPALQPAVGGNRSPHSPVRRRLRCSDGGGVSPGGAEGEGSVNWSAMVMACSAARWAAGGTAAAAGWAGGVAATAREGERAASWANGTAHTRGATAKEGVEAVSWAREGGGAASWANGSSQPRGATARAGVVGANGQSPTADAQISDARTAGARTCAGCAAAASGCGAVGGWRGALKRMLAAHEMAVYAGATRRSQALLITPLRP